MLNQHTRILDMCRCGSHKVQHSILSKDYLTLYQNFSNFIYIINNISPTAARNLKLLLLFLKVVDVSRRMKSIRATPIFWKQRWRFGYFLARYRYNILYWAGQVSKIKKKKFGRSSWLPLRTSYTWISYHSQG